MRRGGCGSGYKLCVQERPAGSGERRWLSWASSVKKLPTTGRSGQPAQAVPKPRDRNEFGVSSTEKPVWQVAKANRSIPVSEDGGWGTSGSTYLIQVGKQGLFHTFRKFTSHPCTHLPQPVLQQIQLALPQTIHFPHPPSHSQPELSPSSAIAS